MPKLPFFFFLLLPRGFRLSGAEQRQIHLLNQQRQEIYSQAIENVAKRVDQAFERFLKGDFKDQRSGRPCFKSQGQFKTFTYP